MNILLPIAIFLFIWSLAMITIRIIFALKEGKGTIPAWQFLAMVGSLTFIICYFLK